jgi:hypothetical protein
LVQPIQQVKKDFFKALLQGERQVHVALGNFGVRAARLAK